MLINRFSPVVKLHGDGRLKFKSSDIWNRFLQNGGYERAIISDRLISYPFQISKSYCFRFRSFFLFFIQIESIGLDGEDGGFDMVVAFRSELYSDLKRLKPDVMDAVGSELLEVVDRLKRSIYSEVVPPEHMIKMMGCITSLRDAKEDQDFVLMYIQNI